MASQEQPSKIPTIPAIQKISDEEIERQAAEWLTRCKLCTTFEEIEDVLCDATWFLKHHLEVERKFRKLGREKLLEVIRFGITRDQP
jgi:hypothetical protein